MKRAPIVLAGTAAGLAGVLSYHAAAPTSATGLTSAATSTSARTTGSTPAASAQTSTTSSSSATNTTSTTTSAAEAKARTATGTDVGYQYGDLELKVTMRNGKITDVSVVKLDVTDPRSQSIDEGALPELRAEALSAQSAKIDGVSGASYTSAAYVQSLQSALDKLK
jgi:uncharacterized protein with FMN-binding domain